MLTPEDRAKAARTPRQTRRQKMQRYEQSFAQMRKEFPRMALPMIAQAEAGSLVAAVKLLCLDCSGWQKNEVRDCVITRCPLYPNRPYQRKA